MENALFNSFLNETHLGKIMKDIVKCDFTKQDDRDTIIRLMKSSFEAGQNYEMIRNLRTKHKA